MGERILWTPILIVTSPPKGSAMGETSTTTKAIFEMGTFGWVSKKESTEGTGAEDGQILMICQLAKWAIYHVYDADKWSGAIVNDYGYHAKVIDWEQFGHRVTDIVELVHPGETDYRNIPTKTEWTLDPYGTYETVEVDLRYKRPYDDPDEVLATSGGARWRKLEGKSGMILKVDAKVKISQYVSTGLVKLEYTCSSEYYFEYYFPKGHCWRIDYLGPTGLKWV